MKRFVSVILLLAVSQAPIAAQTSGGGPSTLETILIPGVTLWITDESQAEEKLRIVEVSADTVTATAGDETRRLRMADITRIRTPHSDSVLNGALIGAGAAVASGLFLCNLTEPWENCRDDVGPMLRIAAVGAGVGIGIDALIRGRKTVYEAPRSTRLQANPIVGRHAAGLRLSLRF